MALYLYIHPSKKKNEEGWKQEAERKENTSVGNVNEKHETYLRSGHGASPEEARVLFAAVVRPVLYVTCRAEIPRQGRLKKIRRKARRRADNPKKTNKEDEQPYVELMGNMATEEARKEDRDRRATGEAETRTPKHELKTICKKKKKRKCVHVVCSNFCSAVVAGAVD